MGKNCCVPKCDSYTFGTAAPDTTKISFHRFPKVTNTNSNETREKDLRQKWINSIPRKD